VCEENETYPTLQKYPEISRNQRWLESSPRISMDDFSMKHGWILAMFVCFTVGCVDLSPIKITPENCRPPEWAAAVVNGVWDDETNY